MKNILILILSLPLWQGAGPLPDPARIMGKTRDLSITGSMTANIELTITEKNGGVRERSLSIASKSYVNGDEKRLIKFLEPSDVRGTAMLIFDNKDTPDEMWIYLPALKKTRRIVTTEKGKSFMSSEFSNSDMSSPTISDFSYHHISGSGNDDQWIIESVPGTEKAADEYGYSKKVSYINAQNYRIEKMEFYNFDNKLYKIIEIKKVLPLDGDRYLVSDMSVENILNGRKSEIVFNNIREGVKVDDSFFSLQNLER
jgi:outer membrane lipoprotein-sorting protein